MIWYIISLYTMCNLWITYFHFLGGIEELINQNILHIIFLSFFFCQVIVPGQNNSWIGLGGPQDIMQPKCICNYNDISWREDPPLCTLKNCPSARLACTVALPGPLLLHGAGISEPCWIWLSAGGIMLLFAALKINWFTLPVLDTSPTASLSVGHAKCLDN